MFDESAILSTDPASFEEKKRRVLDLMTGRGFLLYEYVRAGELSGAASSYVSFWKDGAPAAFLEPAQRDVVETLWREGMLARSVTAAGRGAFLLVTYECTEKARPHFDEGALRLTSEEERSATGLSESRR